MTSRELRQVGSAFGVGAGSGCGPESKAGAGYTQLQLIPSSEVPQPLGCRSISRIARGFGCRGINIAGFRSHSTRWRENVSYFVAESLTPINADEESTAIQSLFVLFCTMFGYAGAHECANNPADDSAAPKTRKCGSERTDYQRCGRAARSSDRSDTSRRGESSDKCAQPTTNDASRHCALWCFRPGFFGEFLRPFRIF